MTTCAAATFGTTLKRIATKIVAEAIAVRIIFMTNL
jgi:hypothetical protein